MNCLTEGPSLEHRYKSAASTALAGFSSLLLLQIQKDHFKLYPLLQNLWVKPWHFPLTSVLHFIHNLQTFEKCKLWPPQPSHHAFQFKLRMFVTHRNYDSGLRGSDGSELVFPRRQRRWEIKRQLDYQEKQINWTSVRQETPNLFKYILSLWLQHICNSGHFKYLWPRAVTKVQAVSVTVAVDITKALPPGVPAVPAASSTPSQEE